MAEKKVPKIRIEWSEEVTCAHEFTPEEARKFFNDQFEEQLPDTATAMQIAEALDAEDLADALAEIDQPDEYGVERSSGEVSCRWRMPKKEGTGG